MTQARGVRGGLLGRWLRCGSVSTRRSRAFASSEAIEHPRRVPPSAEAGRWKKGLFCAMTWRYGRFWSLVEASSGLGSLSSPSVETERTGLQGDSFLLLFQPQKSGFQSWQ